MSVYLRIEGPIRRDDLPALSDRCCAFFAANAGEVVDCDVGGVNPDAVCVDALARLQVVARRNGCRIVLVNASVQLRQLVELLGLTDVLT